LFKAVKNIKIKILKKHLDFPHQGAQIFFILATSFSVADFKNETQKQRNL
jgi:hypothetical protein